MRKPDLSTVIKLLQKERGLSKEDIKEAIEDAICHAFRKNYGGLTNIRAEVDTEKGKVSVYQIFEVVSKVFHDKIQISLDEARKINADAKIGDLIEKETNVPISRIAAQAARNVVTQRLVEAEKSIIYKQFLERKGEITTGQIYKVKPKGVIVNLGKVDGIIPVEEMVNGEKYAPGKKIKVIIKDVLETPKGWEIILSRASTELVLKLFKLEVPELDEGIVEIVSIAREPGYRTKIAIKSRKERMDPVGTLVGYRGQRIRNILSDLGGEKIDIVPYSDDPAKFIAASLSPAKIVSVELFDDRTAEVVVPDKELSLAIGKSGQNARLAAKLTMWKIDILSESEKESLEKEYKRGDFRIEREANNVKKFEIKGEEKASEHTSEPDKGVDKKANE